MQLTRDAQVLERHSRVRRLVFLPTLRFLEILALKPINSKFWDAVVPIITIESAHVSSLTLPQEEVLVGQEMISLVVPGGLEGPCSVGGRVTLW